MVQRGDLLRVRGERWRVVHAARFDDGCVVVDVGGAERSNAGESRHFILPFEPADRLPPAVERPRAVGASAWRRIARAALADAAPSWHSLRAAAAADVALLPFQLEPALAMTSGRGCRFLLADEVGLGKTIQAGLMAAELLARERDARILILTPASLREQWGDELRARFAIDAAVFDAAGLVRAAAGLPPSVNPWSLARVAIASIDFVKRADVIRSLEPLAWDLLIVDEAHILSGRSERATAAQLLAQRSRRVVLISATPHNGDEHAFERLCGTGALRADDRLLIFRRSRIEAGLPRRRRLKQLHVTLTREEARMHRALAVYAERVSREAPRDSKPAAQLAMLVLARRASSSAWSLARSLERRMRLLREGEVLTPGQMRLPLDEEMLAADEEPASELAAAGLASAETEQRCLEDLLQRARRVQVDSKIAALRRLLARTDEPIIVFTEYRDTLARLAASLAFDSTVLHGGMTTAERAAAVRRFTQGSARLLLATDAASEGLNLHHRCRLVVHLDVPWTPLRLEQRVGRVDRLGQQRPVHSLTLVARATGEATIAAGLAARSERADQGAPFGTGDAPSQLLRAEAATEAVRVQQCRRLAVRRRPSRPSHSRPVLLTSERHPDVVLAIRFTFVDASGALVWDTMAALGIPGVAYHQVLAESPLAIAAAAAEAHECLAVRLRSELRASCELLAERERAMLDRVTATEARLAAPLVQAGLFDRRSLRDVDAQRRVAGEVASRSRSRIAALERQARAISGGRWLVFAVTR